MALMPLTLPLTARPRLFCARVSSNTSSKSVSAEWGAEAAAGGLGLCLRCLLTTSNQGRRALQGASGSQQTDNRLAIIDIPILGASTCLLQTDPVDLDQFTGLVRHFDRIQPLG